MYSSVGEIDRYLVKDFSRIFESVVGSFGRLSVLCIRNLGMD